MRALIVGCVAVAFCAGCGSSSPVTSNTDGGSGQTGGTQLNLRITTSGNGVVRGAGGDCRGSCSVPYSSGTQVHLAAVPDSGATFLGWAGACGGTSGCDLTLDADRDVSATFAAAPPPPPGRRHLTVNIQGKGRVTSSPAGLDCDSATCTADFADGTSVALAATASSGFGFTGWGNDCSGGGGCTITLTKDATVFANFVAQPPPPPPPPAQVHLNVTTAGPGTVTGAGLNCGESSSVCDVTLAGGSSVTLSAQAAGGARFFGWGGACSGTSGTCQLTLQSDAKVTAEFQSEVMALAPNDGTNNSIIALNSTQVFWPRWSDGNGIWAIAKKGGNAVRVAGGYANAIVADDGYLYWTDSTTIYSTPVGGGQVALLFSGGPVGRLALDEIGALYWTVASGSSPGSVHRMMNRTDAVLASGQDPIGAVAVDANHLYFANYGSDGGSIRRVSRKGGAAESVFSCGTYCYPQALRLDSENLYFRLYYTTTTSTNGHVQAMSKSDFKVRTLSSANGDGNYQYGLELDVNASVVYWNWVGGTGPYGIFSVNADGSGFKAIDSSSNVSAFGVRADDSAIYYWKAGAIIRRLK